MDVTVRDFLAYFGGRTKVVIEDQDYDNKTYWSGNVDEWFNSEEQIHAYVDVLSATVINDMDILFVRINP